MTAPVRDRWRLVAPWYRWDHAADPDPDRAAAAARPAIQKYGGASFVADLLRDPRPSLTYTTEDLVQQLQAVPPLPAFTTGANAHKARQLGLRTMVPTETRKLFQPVHQRFYVVVVELHCDTTGFPPVDPTHVAEVGFVVRRRVSDVPTAQARVAAQHLAGLATARARARHEADLEAARVRTRALVPFRSPARALVPVPQAATTAAFRDVVTAKRALAQWSLTAGVTTTTQAWVPGAVGEIGGWADTVDEPGEIVEQTYPMYRLAPDPLQPDHPARHGTIFFGVLPVAGEQAAEDGSPAFDDTHLFEVRCFARREAGDCPEPPTWSEATEPYGIAGAFDPAGCAHRPVNIRMPDFRALAATNVRPTVRMSTPAGSHLMFPTDDVPPTSGSVGTDEEICFFAIPLIMIVAFFLLNLFLPIILLVFQLWWMLKLKFCIPPSIELAADVTAELSVIPGGLEAAAGFDIDIVTGVDQTSLRDALRNGLNGTNPGLGDQLTAKLTNNAIVQALLVQGLGTSGEQQYPATLPTEPLVTRAEVVHP